MARLSEACAAGARREAACRAVGLSVRTWQRWQREGQVKADGRTIAVHRPANQLSEEERQRLLAVANAPEFCSLPPSQIVPALADRGEYLASESTFYRVLRAEGQLQRRGRARPPTRTAPESHRATAPNQLWSWDITYLATTIRGVFFYLYLILDVYSRKIVGLEVFEAESAEHATTVVRRAYLRESIAGQPLVLHSDNGAPMKGATLLATLQKLGVVPSFSRPSVSNDNPYSEALFRTLKYVPSYPGKPFETVEQARDWALGFQQWYNEEHKHSALKFVTPAERHRGEDEAVLARRRTVYETARVQHPERWSGRLRHWEVPKEVWLNPPKHGHRLTRVTPM
jgi:transposase InsO family protein